MKIKSSAKGFTLIELLVVVLIIGILSVIALPMYRKAVERSRVSDALTTMQAVAKSEHGWYLTNNSYTKDFSNLDIDLIDENGEKADGESYDTVNYTFTLQNNNIKAERANGEYTLYKLYEDPNIYCLPQENEICQQFGWGVNRQLCEGINGAWSNVKNKCYNNEQERCAATSNPEDEIPASWQKSYGGYCGFSAQNGVNATEFQKCMGTCNYSSFTGEGSKCISGIDNNCGYSYFYQGAECYTQAGGVCSNSYFAQGSVCGKDGNSFGCFYSTFTSNSICYGNTGDTCKGSTINEGSQCISKNHSCEFIFVNEGGKCVTTDDSKRWACYGTYTGTGCCEGPNCPASTPKCYCEIDPNTGMHLTSC